VRRGVVVVVDVAVLHVQPAAPNEPGLEREPRLVAHAEQLEQPLARAAGDHPGVVIPGDQGQRMTSRQMLAQSCHEIGVLRHDGLHRLARIAARSIQRKVEDVTG
jgi:hypothetical protein